MATGACIVYNLNNIILMLYSSKPLVILRKLKIKPDYLFTEKNLIKDVKNT